MKRILLILFLIIIAGLGWYYFKYFQGIWPTIRPPQANIVSLINQAKDIADNEAVRVGEINKLLNDNSATNSTAELDFYQQGPLNLPVGFSISTFAEGLGAPRVIINAPDNGLLVSIPSQGRVVYLPDKNNDGTADEVKTVVDNLNRPHGLVFDCTDQEKCWLYVAETDKVVRFSYNTVDNSVNNRQELFTLPGGGRHWTRTILFAEIDGQTKLLTSVGSSCDTCQENDWRRAKILMSDLDGSNLEVLASGLRNSVFMAIQPVTGEVWATEMGRDFLGDDLPPDEINIIKSGQDYGWPICYGDKIHDTSFDKNQYVRDPCLDTVSPQISIQAHSAPLGLAFVPADSDWPKYLWNDLLVAYHGSWNRSVPTGYKIVRFALDSQGNYLDRQDFISGWLVDKNNSLGRPVDILVRSDGTAFISDDKAGVIYRLVYN